ncbi:cation:proton antiporter [Schlesneria sp. T3-172]|uniref:cation:proton antiporter n=1 Tax=Schlesneria sphaerica TaxID=3373610 RepID=UPI0037CAB883
MLPRFCSSFVFLLLCALILAAAGRTSLAEGSVPVPAAASGETHATEEGTAAQAHGASHEDPVTPMLLGLLLVLVTAKLAGALATRLKQPAVLGELLVGVLLGNLILVGWDQLEFLRPVAVHAGDSHSTNLVATTMDMLARIGVILLLFEVGLESSVGQMLTVGWSSLAVAVLGVVAPFGLGWFAGQLLLPDHSWHVHMFLGATLSATSVGITARVFKDLGKSDTKVAKVVLGAAVIDDVLGLVLLAVVQAVIVQGSANLSEVALIVGKALVFLFGSVILGDWLSPYLFRVAALLRVNGMLMITGLAFCFGLSWLSSQMGLAPIVGAFAAGMILDEKHYRALQRPDERSLEEWVLPVTTLLVPIFFVMMGFQVDLRSFLNPGTLGLAAGITIAAILGKMACAAGVLERGIDRLSVGFGMIPRGEVGLIFAAIGQGLVSNGIPIIDAGVYSAVVVMVMVTTFLAPPLLNWSLLRHQGPTVTPTQ